MDRDCSWVTETGESESQTRGSSILEGWTRVIKEVYGVDLR